jgi:hypothetical protein
MLVLPWSSWMTVNLQLTVRSIPNFTVVVLFERERETETEEGRFYREDVKVLLRSWSFWNYGLASPPSSKQELCLLGWRTQVMTLVF